MKTRTRPPLAYLGGVRAVRALTRTILFVYVTVSLVLFWRITHTHDPLGYVLLALTQVGAIVSSLGVRLIALRAVVVSRKTWTLVPIVGSPRCMSHVSDVYIAGEDVIVLGPNGRSVVLGIDRFPFRESELARRALVESLRSVDRFAETVPMARFPRSPLN